MHTLLNRRRGLERPAPLRLWLLFGLALLGQLTWAVQRPSPTAQAEDLPAPPALVWLQAMALGEPGTWSRLVMLWLQAFDNQPGVSIPFQALDYTRVTDWLDRALGLDPTSRYPLVAASRVYAAVADPARKRHMAAWVRRQFLQDPGRRWFALAHMATLAKHELHDLPYALELARELRPHPDIPHWATQMEIFLLADMGEVETARVLLGGLLDSGQITDPNEHHFLLETLMDMTEQADKTKNAP